MKKEKDGCTFAKPDAGQLADESDVASLLNAVSGAKMKGVAAESAENLGKYGLNAPPIAFTATNESGKSATLLVGKKEGIDYYAKDSSRPTIFKVNETLYKKLTENYGDLRDKKLVHLRRRFHRAESPRTARLLLLKAEQDCRGSPSKKK